MNYDDFSAELFFNLLIGEVGVPCGPISKTTVTWHLLSDHGDRYDFSEVRPVDCETDCVSVVPPIWFGIARVEGIGVNPIFIVGDDNG